VKDEIQLEFFSLLEEKDIEASKVEQHYRNGLGELLPWELPIGQSYDN
jgi:hypothetical protein